MISGNREVISWSKPSQRYDWNRRLTVKIGKLNSRRFNVTDRRKGGFPSEMSLHYHIYIVKYIFTSRDDKFENLGESTVCACEMFTSGFCSWLRNVTLGYLRANLKIIIHFGYMRLYCSPEATFCLPWSQTAKKEMDYSLKKLADFWSSHSAWTDQVFGPESTLARSFRSRRSSSRVRRGILPTSKDNRELYCEIWSRKQQKHHDITPFSASEPKYNRPSAFSARFLHWRSFVKLFQLSAEILCKRQGRDSACKKN